MFFDCQCVIHCRLLCSILFMRQVMIGPLRFETCTLHDPTKTQRPCPPPPGPIRQRPHHSRSAPSQANRQKRVTSARVFSCRRRRHHLRNLGPLPLAAILALKGGRPRTYKSYVFFVSVLWCFFFFANKLILVLSSIVPWS